MYANERQFNHDEEPRRAIEAAWNSVYPAIMENFAKTIPDGIFELASNHGGPVNC